jgi:hypothetical protein
VESLSSLPWNQRPVGLGIGVQLTWNTHAKAGVERARKDFDVLWALIHTWPQGTAAQNRKKFAAVIRSVLTNIREHRERINGFCAPGVPTARLP